MPNVGPRELFAELKRLWSGKAYAALKKACAGTITQWRWATFAMLPEVPHEELVRGMKPPQWAKKQPRYGSLHGLDKAGHVQCIRSDVLEKPDAEVREQFLIHDDGGFWCVAYAADAKKAIQQLSLYDMPGDVFQRSLSIGGNGLHEHLLDWQGDRLIRHTWRLCQSVTLANAGSASALAKIKRERPDVTVDTYTYADDGALQSMTSSRDMGENEPPWVEVKYQRMPKGATLASLLREAEDMLVVEIPRAIRAAKVREPVYAVLVQFTGVDTDMDGFAPPLFMPRESLRRRLAAEHPNDPEYLWMVPEWEQDPEVARVWCKNPALDEKLHFIFQLTITQPSLPKYGPVRKMFQRACARLNALDWKGILKPTDDFIVVPFDTHSEFDANADRKASVPAAKLRLLMERG
jgi:hypothetical protein